MCNFKSKLPSQVTIQLNSTQQNRDKADTISSCIFLITGIILTGNDITALLFGIIITYLVGRGHKPRWIFVGMLFIMSFCVLTALPHLLYGSGTESLALTEEYRTLHAVALRNATDTSLCTGEGPSCIKEGSLTPQIIFFVAQLMWGIGSPLYGNLGMAYMDDNMKRSKTPLLMSKYL